MSVWLVPNTRRRSITIMPLEQPRGIIIATLLAFSAYRMEKLVQIVCATPEAAAEVLSILYAAHLQLRQNFTIQPVLSITPPFIFSMLVTLPTAQVTKIRAVADTEIVG
jgi:hypothetical protein